MLPSWAWNANAVALLEVVVAVADALVLHALARELHAALDVVGAAPTAIEEQAGGQVALVAVVGVERLLDGGRSIVKRLTSRIEMSFGCTSDW